LPLVELEFDVCPTKHVSSPLDPANHTPEHTPQQPPEKGAETGAQSNPKSRPQKLTK